MNNPFDYTPDAECVKAYLDLTEYIGRLKLSNQPEQMRFCHELDEGKMLGVLIAEDNDGVRHTLYAFSGQLGHGGFMFPGFVEPVFDYLQPDGYFKVHERDISLQNARISEYEKCELASARREYEQMLQVADSRIEEFRQQCRRSKMERDARRAANNVSEDEIKEMIRQSQFEKAELHRMKKKMAADLLPFEQRLKEAERHIESLKEKRHTDSENLQKWLFDNFRVLNARGEWLSLSEIFAETPMKTPPSGAGECCAPKLLQAAYLRGWHPLAMAEYWYGKPKGGELRIEGEYYPACRGKCLPVLSWMLQGLEVQPPLDTVRGGTCSLIPEILYENEWFCVINKPSGMLSVPGKGNSVSVQEWLMEHYGGKNVKMAHRLDQDTSGLLIATFTDEAYKLMQRMFATRQIKKTYIALLEGDYTSKRLPTEGVIHLPLSPDWLDRPRQRVDFDGGKEAVTEYRFIDATDGRSRVMFTPLTGRTHQLRVHAASQMGLGMPIWGDPLYGSRTGNAGRLHLHAQKLEFTFPLDNKPYCFELPATF
ncbi:MAG: RNA pseudouridine synthase [Bacteroidales bacterium]|nr:RNA pseudouridine synthase [Bacteroidales bacterium]